MTIEIGKFVCFCVFLCIYSLMTMFELLHLGNVQV